jgi:hypothetical protein
VKKVLTAILFLSLLHGLPACSGGGGGGCITSEECDPGWGCSLGRCVPLTPGQDVETEGGEVADMRPDPYADTPREEAVEQPPEVLDAPSETDAPSDAQTEDGPPPAGFVGDSCTTPEDCVGVPASDKQCLTDIMGFITFVGGYCSAACTGDDECDAAVAGCSNMGIASYCLRLCSGNEDCRAEEGYTCATIATDPSDRTYCIPS